MLHADLHHVDACFIPMRRAPRPRSRSSNVDAMDRVRQKCPQVEWISSYAVLGPCDYLDIFRAPDIEAAAARLDADPHLRARPDWQSGRRRRGIASRNWCARCPAPAERSSMDPSTQDHSPRCGRIRPAIVREVDIPAGRPRGGFACSERSAHARDLRACGAAPAASARRNRAVAAALNDRRIGDAPVRPADRAGRSRSRECLRYRDRWRSELADAVRFVEREPSLSGLCARDASARAPAQRPRSSAAVPLGDRIGAIVSRGGRPDLAGECADTGIRNARPC